MPSLQSVSVKGKKYWRVVESRRINGKPRPVPICYLGSIENIICLVNGENGDKSQIINIQSFEHGSIAALMAILKEIDVVSIIDKHVNDSTEFPSVGETLVLAALNRAICPKSKRGWTEWAEGVSITRFFPHINIKKMTSQHFWSQMNKISEEKLEEIENELTKKIIKLYSIEPEIFFYDTTNFFTFIDSENSRCELPQRGRNKQKRTDLRQFSLALLISRDGQIPLFSHTYEGNIVDVSKFPDSLTRMRKRLEDIVGDLKGITLVYDKGNNSKKNQHLVDSAKIGYIASLSLYHHTDLRDIPTKDYNTIKQGDLVGTKFYRLRKTIWDAERTAVLCISEKLRHGQIRELEQELTKVLQKLQEWKEQLKKTNSGPKSKKNAENKIRKILKGQYAKKLIKPVYNRRRKRENRLSWVIDEKQRKQFEEEIFGKRLLITNREAWSTEEIIKGYHDQGYIEETFRQSKDDEHFAIRPQYHWTDQKIRVHVFICLLALMMGRILERKARVLGRKECLSSLIEKLSKIRLALVLKGGKRGKHFADASWILEKCPKNLSSMFRQLVPNKEPFVYTPNFQMKGFHR